MPMAQILRLKCNGCSFTQEGAMTHAYAVNLAGERQYCRHPGQDVHACEILGIDYDLVVDAMGMQERGPRYQLPDGTTVPANEFVQYFESRCGVVQGFLCMACAKWIELDVKNDPLQCVHCQSEGIFKFEELDGRACPICKEGRICAIQLGIT